LLPHLLLDPFVEELEEMVLAEMVAAVANEGNRWLGTLGAVHGIPMAYADKKLTHFHRALVKP
jgi:hypothetical protein